MAYCVQADIEARFRRWFPTGFSDTTKPTVSDVLLYINDVAGELDGIIVSFGFTAPVTQTNVIDMLKRANVFGAAAEVARTAFPEKIGADKDALAVEFEALYQEEKKNLETFDNPVLAILQETYGSRRPISNYTQYPDTVINPPTGDPTIDLAPMFPRGVEY